MVNVVSVGEFDLDEGALHAAADTYLDFRSTEEDQGTQNRELLDSVHSWVNQHDLTADTISEYTSELREATEDDHSTLSEGSFDDLEAKAADDAGTFVEDLVALFEDESSLEDRIERFRTNQGIELPVISVLLATFDPDRYVLYDEEDFGTLIRYFTGLHSPDLGDLSVGRRYDLYRSYCSTIQTDVLSEKLADATLQDAQEFVGTVTHSVECRYNFILRYLFRHTSRLETFEEETSVFLDEIRTLPQAFLRDQLEAYEGRQKIAKIRAHVDESADTNVEDIVRVLRELRERLDITVGTRAAIMASEGVTTVDTPDKTVLTDICTDVLASKGAQRGDVHELREEIESAIEDMEVSLS